VAKIKKPTISPPAPFEQTQETVETPDVEAFRAFAPDTSMLESTVAKRFGDRRREIRDSYGAYSGIPSQVARNEMRDEALAGVDEAEGLALAEGNEKAQALKLAQLEALAALTAKRKSSGFNTSVIQPQGSNLAGSAISGGAGIGAAVLPSIIAA
jgi:hypothetical protein